MTKLDKLTPLVNAVLKGEGVEGELINLLEDTADWDDGEDGS